MKFHRLYLAVFLLAALLFTGCAQVSASRENKRPKARGAFVSFKKHSAFKARGDYPETSRSYRDEDVFARTDSSNSRILISLSLQRAFLMNGDEVAIDYPVSTGKTTHPTPAGDYTILEKLVEKRSNLYGRVYDAGGNVVDYSADSRRARIPRGGYFLGASMPYWMRLTWDGIGMHIGEVPRYPASHACIRGQSDVIPAVFSKVGIGTPVTIEN
ncbi:MAG: L,D-transpeptidase family protein [Verrucomicrobiales bacterium]|nr:L,D-transpeptidase family protein [Verrucomicrobiales bacterium]